MTQLVEARSNNGSGWQSNDGVNERPIFQSMMNGVEEFLKKKFFLSLLVIKVMSLNYIMVIIG